MCARPAVLQIPSKSSVPPSLPLYKIHPLKTRSESTLLQVLIPLHFNSLRINTYKKPGEGVPRSTPKVLQLVTPIRDQCVQVTHVMPLSPLTTRHSPLSPLESHLLQTPRVNPHRITFLQKTGEGGCPAPRNTAQKSTSHQSPATEFLRAILPPVCAKESPSSSHAPAGGSQSLDHVAG